VIAMNRGVAAWTCAVAALCGAALAAESYTLTSTWKAPGEGTLSFAGKKVVALVFTADENLRMSAEEALAREISARGPQGVAAYRAIPRELLTDKEKAKGWFDQSGTAGVVALRLVSKDQARVYDAVVWASGYYGNFYDYYGNAWATVSPIGKGHIETTITVETLMYRVSDAKLLWAAVCQTTDPKDPGGFMKGLAKAVVKQLEKEGVVRKGSK
jgi:hypothetical protein